MVLGNTFHLFLTPGHELIRRLGGLHAFMRWDRPVITDSGGFQVFSMGHGTVADEIKGRAAARASAPARSSRIEEAGRHASAPTSTARSASWRPRPRWRSRPRSARTSRSCSTSARRSTSTRDYTARSTERTHRWLDRCLAWHAEHGPAGQVVYGIVQGGVDEDLRRASAQAVAARDRRRDRDRRLARRGQGADVRGGRTGRSTSSPEDAPAPPARDRRRRRPACAASSSGSTRSTARCRRASAATGWRSCPTPARAGASTSPRAAGARPTSRSSRAARARPARAATRAPTCTTCSRRASTTAARLLTLHNLAYLQRLMAALRAAIDAGRLGEAVAAARGGAAPWELPVANVNCAVRRGCELPRRAASSGPAAQGAPSRPTSTQPPLTFAALTADAAHAATACCRRSAPAISSTASCTPPRTSSRSCTARFASSCTAGRSTTPSTITAEQQDEAEDGAERAALLARGARAGAAAARRAGGARGRAAAGRLVERLERPARALRPAGAASRARGAVVSPSIRVAAVRSSAAVASVGSGAPPRRPSRERVAHLERVLVAALGQRVRARASTASPSARRHVRVELVGDGGGPRLLQPREVGQRGGLVGQAAR